LKNFTVRRKVPDSLFTSDDAQEQLTEILRPMVPFVSAAFGLLFFECVADEAARFRF
jgi:hypothetical protein